MKIIQIAIESETSEHYARMWALTDTGRLFQRTLHKDDHRWLEVENNFPTDELPTHGLKDHKQPVGNIPMHIGVDK